jgi:outer membrane protein TolC
MERLMIGRLTMRGVAIAAIACQLAPVRGAMAQAAATADSLTLGALQAEALQRDPRGRQLELLGEQSALRLRSIAASRLPTLGASAQGQYQSEVVTIPFTLPGGIGVPVPPHTMYDAHLDAREALLDPTLAGRRGVERAQLAQSRAQLRSSLYALRQNVNDAYFTALQMQAQSAELETGVIDLQAQLGVVAARVRHGAALPGDSAILTAELLRRRQSLAELAANRDAAIEVLAELTGRTIGGAAALTVPDLGAEVARVRAASAPTRARPEFEQFARTRELLAEQRAAAGARDLPRVSAFGRAGYGRPGLNPLARDFGSYWLAGVLVEWTPWNWGTTTRDREVLALQQQVVASDEAAFDESIRRAVVHDLATIDRLEKALGEDETIIALREQVLHEAQLRFSEGVVTSAEYIDRQTDVLAARLARASHRVELAQARARYLTTVGAEVP